MRWMLCGPAGVWRDRKPERRGSNPPEARIGTNEEGTGFFTRSGSVLSQRVVLKYEAIQRYRDEFPILMMCRCLNVSNRQ